MPWKSSMEIGTRVFSQESENLIYNASTITFNQYEAPMANAPPKGPIGDLKTSVQQKAMWKHTINEEESTSGEIKLCIR